MSIQESPKGSGRFLIQLYAADPLLPNDPLWEGEKRWCERAPDRKAAETVLARFKAEKTEWVATRKLLKEALRKGLRVHPSGSTPPSEIGFASFLEKTYLPWGVKNLEAETMRARQGTLMILAEDLAERPLHKIEMEIDDLVTKPR